MEKRNEKSYRTKGMQGYTLVEMVTVMAIMAILGTLLISLLDLGVKFYRTEDLNMDNENNARLAVAYVTVKIRQNDVAGAISVINELDSSGNQIKVLKIKDASDPTEDNYFWIYFDSSVKKLREQRGKTFVESVDDSEITEIDDFDIGQSGCNINFVVIEGPIKFTQDITLRSTS